MEKTNIWRWLVPIKTVIFQPAMLVYCRVTSQEIHTKHRMKQPQKTSCEVCLMFKPPVQMFVRSILEGPTNRLPCFFEDSEVLSSSISQGKYMKIPGDLQTAHPNMMFRYSSWFLETKLPRNLLGAFKTKNPIEKWGQPKNPAPQKLECMQFSWNKHICFINDVMASQPIPTQRNPLRNQGLRRPYWLVH